MMDEQTDEQRMVLAKAMTEPVQIKIPAYNAFIICGLLQLAVRDPAFMPGSPSYETAMLMIEDLKEVLAGIDPFFKELI